MSFRLENVVPWGRSFDEYLAMFVLDQSDLTKRILGCGDGPASFNAVATTTGVSVVSADPVYAFSAAEIQSRIDATAAIIGAELRDNRDEFVWDRFDSADALIEARLRAMGEFLADYPEGLTAERYIDAELPRLPFADDAFELALCSHFLFLYSEQHSLDFHVDSALELSRVAPEVRIFPLLELGSKRSRHLAAFTERLRKGGLGVEIVTVPYEMQKGGNEMLRIRRPDRRSNTRGRNAELLRPVCALWRQRLPPAPEQRRVPLPSKGNNGGAVWQRIEAISSSSRAQSTCSF